MKKLLAITATALILPITSQAASLDREQQQQVKALVREALLENPEIFIEVVSELKKREELARTQAQNSVLTQSVTELFNNSEDPFAGSSNPKLSIVYFGDVNCGFCKQQDPVLEALVKHYPDLKIIYKDLPILGPSSREAAALSLAARAEGNDAYLALHKQFISHPARHDSNSIASSVSKQGLDLDALKSAVDNDINQQLDSNIRLAERLGITGTPALVFPDEVIGGFTDEDALKEMIDQRLKQIK
ncbi:DsbA family protein [Endozoicomonas sp. SCSIO W0465]|uniref:DsbA family protein n=1 Tax=Endozoicomonas sp. SCSIO W0465 TaxID=2918516 RepID=UPI002074F272|nr:DsbA family protein [Endozoicomonas sp. SCSIO W0465]USE38001.1 DsbA family protein [Endozoicomonas sp. SCSIO W0465]